jgi:molecular chaperone DnaJ
MTPYEALGVDKDAPQEAIKRAYVQLARDFHPDKTGGDDTRFKEIAFAYSKIGTMEDRLEYDRLNSASYQYHRLKNVLRPGETSDEVQAKAYEPIRGMDKETDLTIPVSELLKGFSEEISYKIMGVCLYCGGSGAKKRKKCPRCLEKGRDVECKVCNGTFVVTDVVCEHCEGGRLMESVRKCRVEATIDDIYNKKRFVGFGHAGFNGGDNGDLVLTIKPKLDKEIVEFLKANFK